MAIDSLGALMHYECMGSAPRPNPIRRYKDREKITYPLLAERLGISEDYARKLGASIVRSVSPEMAKQFETRTEGAIKYIEVMRWVESHLGDSDGAAA